MPPPGAGRDEVDLGLGEGELLLRTGPYRRAVALPDALRRRPVTDAVLLDDALHIRFGTRPAAAAAPGGWPS